MSYLKFFLQHCDKVEDHLETIGYLSQIDLLMKHHPQIGHAILSELENQRSSLKMIASENYSSLAVQLAMGNLLTDKYAEGYAGHRFYAGCENVDEIEHLACDLAKRLFHAEHAYVQPHSGSDANLVALWAILINRVESKELEKLSKKSVAELSSEEYETIRKKFSEQKMLALSLDSGGHLTHGSRVNISSKMVHAISYSIDPSTERIDYKKIEEIAKREKPLILLAGYSAYPRLIDFSIMQEIASSIGATFMVDMAHFAGLVAGGVMQGNYNPVPFADIVTSTTHKTLRGPRGGLILCKKEYASFIDRGCPIALGGPLPHIMAAKAVAFKEALRPEFKLYAAQIVKNAKALSNRLLHHGVKILSGGTDNHIILLNIKESFNLSGRQAEQILNEVGITVNRNTLPGDTLGPWYTSGIRIGTPALTTRGMKEREMEKIADMIYMLLKETKSEVVPGQNNFHTKPLCNFDVLQTVKHDREKLLIHFPLYPEIMTHREEKLV